VTNSIFRLRQRAKARTLPTERKDYCFDLDVREHQDDEDGDDDRFTVDSYSAGSCLDHVLLRPSYERIFFATGNWTRFIKYFLHPLS
jgi:hypothetical protein